jgi:hypothetical protein
VSSKSKNFKFLKRDCGTIPVAEIINGKIEIFSKHQRFLIATESSKYLLIFVYMSVLYCVNLEQLYLKDMLIIIIIPLAVTSYVSLKKYKYNYTGVSKKTNP